MQSNNWIRMMTGTVLSVMTVSAMGAASTFTVSVENLQDSDKQKHAVKITVSKEYFEKGEMVRDTKVINRQTPCLIESDRPLFGIRVSVDAPPGVKVKLSIVERWTPENSRVAATDEGSNHLKVSAIAVEPKRKDK
jgi:hypothetical protein